MTRRTPPLLFWAWAVAVAAGLAAGGLHAQDEGGGGDSTTTTEREGFIEGWKGLPGAVDPGEPGKSDGWVEVDLKVVPETDWKFRTPNDTAVEESAIRGAWIGVTGGNLPLVGSKGGKIRFETRTSQNMLDSDGDGQCDLPIKSELVAVRARHSDGTEGPFYFRLRRVGSVYWYSRACMAVGKFNGQSIAFIDENNNGDFGDPGADAVRIGSSIVAIAQSPVVNLNNELFHVRVTQAGTKAWFKPYEGPTGKIDLASKYRAKSPVLYATIAQGEIVFNGAERGGVVVPVGTWQFVDGLVGPSIYQCAKIKQGHMPAFEVKKDETTTVAWGMPGKIEFVAEKNGNALRIPLSSIKIYGSAGEEYMNFRPKVFSPFVQAVEVGTGKEVLYTNMGMGC